MGFPDKSRSHAVLIGAAAFDDRNLSPLPAVARNLSTLRDLLTDPDHGSFSRDRCTPFLDPTYSANVPMALTRIVRLVEDVLLVYYAGHGVIGEHDGQLHLALQDTGMQDPDSTSLPFRRL
jgi:hypothetical protein